MATKKRLIDADKLSNGIALYLAENAYLNDTAQDALEMVVNWVNNAPTVDAVEVVRCKDCQHYVAMSGLDKDFRCSIFCGCYDRPYPTEPDDFCSYGERRTE